MSRTQVNGRLRRGVLCPLHKGVYSFGHDSLKPQGLWMAAVLAAGTGSVLSHSSAASHWGLIAFDRTAAVDVMAARARTGSSPGLATHRTRALRRTEVTILDGIPVTSVARTLLDLASILQPSGLEAAFVEAVRKRILDIGDLSRVIDGRNRGWKGVGAIRDLIERWSPSKQRTRSILESRFLDLCQKSGIPLPAINARVAGLEVDCLWAEQRLIVELDGFSFHGDRLSFERDHERDTSLHAAGYGVMRVTHRMIERTPRVVANAVSARLATS